VIQALQNQEPVNMFYDAWFTPVLIDHLVEAVHELVDKKCSGIINLTGDERVSKYEFALKVADIFALDATLIRRVSCVDMPWPTPRPKDMSLSNARAQQWLGHGIGGVESGLRDLLEQASLGRRDELLAAVSD
jgi:dTDP-4-dehydrorhamnose reductase